MVFCSVKVFERRALLLVINEVWSVKELWLKIVILANIEHFKRYG